MSNINEIEGQSFRRFAQVYLRKALGFRNVDLKDYAGAMVEIDINTHRPKLVNGRYQMGLPLSEKTWNKLISDAGLTLENLDHNIRRKLLTGFICHEVGHIISPEEYEEGHIRSHLSNIINDANENNVIPDEYPGAIKFLMTLNNFLYNLARPITPLDISFEDTPAKIIGYMIRLFGKISSGSSV